MTLGRPSYLGEDVSNVKILNYGDFVPQESRAKQSIPAPGQTFIAMASLTVILSDILQIFYSPRAMDRLSTSSEDYIRGLEERLDSDLEEWRERYLEPILKINSFPDSSGRLSTSGLEELTDTE